MIGDVTDYKGIQFDSCIRLGHYAFVLYEKYLQIAKDPLGLDDFRLSLPGFTDRRLSLHILIVITSTVEFAQERLRLYLVPCHLRSGVGTIIIRLFLDVLE